MLRTAADSAETPEPSRPATAPPPAAAHRGPWAAATVPPAPSGPPARPAAPAVPAAAPHGTGARPTARYGPAADRGDLRGGTGAEH